MPRFFARPLRTHSLLGAAGLLYSAWPLAAVVARINTGIMFLDALLVPLARMCFLPCPRVSPDSRSPPFTSAFLERRPSRLGGKSCGRRLHQTLRSERQPRVSRHNFQN